MSGLISPWNSNGMGCGGYVIGGGGYVLGFYKVGLVMSVQ